MTIKEEMNDLKGQPISVMVAKLGLPSEETTIIGQKVYTWQTGTVSGGDQYLCRIRVVMAGDVIGSYQFKGDTGTCSEYANKLKR